MLEIAIDFDVDHFKGPPDAPNHHIRVPQCLLVLGWEDHKLGERILSQEEGAGAPIRIEPDLGLDVQEHSKGLTSDRLCRDFEILAGLHVLGLACEKLIDHSAAHVVADLVQLSVDVGRILVVRIAQQFSHKHAIGER